MFRKYVHLNNYTINKHIHAIMLKHVLKCIMYICVHTIYNIFSPNKLICDKFIGFIIIS